MAIKTVMWVLSHCVLLRTKDVGHTLMTHHHSWQIDFLIQVWCTRTKEHFLTTSQILFYVSLDNGFVPVKQQSVSKKRQGKRKTHRADGGGVVYPVDLWFLVGSYLAPEDVSTFACICHDTHLVAHSARFWLSLYRRSADQLLLYKEFHNLFLPDMVYQENHQSVWNSHCGMVLGSHSLMVFQSRHKTQLFDSGLQ